MWLSGFSACPHTLQCANCGQQGTCYQSKQVPSLPTVILAFSGSKALGAFGDKNTHPALCDSSSKSCLLFQKPFKMLPQNTFLKKNRNSYLMIMRWLSTANVYESPALKYKRRRREGWFVSFVLTAKFWARRGILVGKWIISQLLRSSEAAIHLSNMHFWT